MLSTDSSAFQVPGSGFVFRFVVHLFVVLGSAFLLTACASSGGVPKPQPFPGAAVSPPPANAPAIPGVPAGRRPPVVLTALTYRGTPYRNGGSDPSGFDCSGFVQWVYAKHGTALPREVRDQYKAGKKIDEDEIKAGDLIFFETVSKGASHVAIAIGGDEFVHAPSSTGVVRVERLSASYWASRYVGARRVLSKTE